MKSLIIFALALFAVGCANSAPKKVTLEDRAAHFETLLPEIAEWINWNTEFTIKRGDELPTVEIYGEKNFLYLTGNINAALVYSESLNKIYIRERLINDSRMYGWLVHEMVHFAQFLVIKDDIDGHAYSCLSELEYEAYKLEQQFLISDGKGGGYTAEQMLRFKVLQKCKPTDKILLSKIL